MFFFAALPLTAAARLDVPYVPQSPSLCGGAAAAMVFRYWGDRHAGVEPFAPLVDRDSGGIAADRLVAAIREGGWQATTFQGSVSELRKQLAADHPIILLIEQHPAARSPDQAGPAEHPTTDHYVVAVGADETGIFVHDPSWGPSRHIPVDALTKMWSPTGFWSLLVLPAKDSTISPDAPDASEPGAGPDAALPPKDGPPAATTQCDQLLQAAVAEIKRQGLDSADSLLSAVREACPQSAAPVAELAGVRFAQRRWREAASLAQTAASTDASNTYAWDVLGSSRYMLDDMHGALAAWNRIGKPKVDSVSITGLKRTRYELVAQALSLEPNTLLTVERFRLAERRLALLPDRSRSRISFVPTADGYAIVEVALAEQATVPRSVGGYAAVGANAAINREITIAVPGSEGQGAIWSGSWRWWENRPRVGLELAAPRVGLLPGTWRVNASWEAQTFATSATAPRQREDQLHAGVTMTNWLNHAWRYEVSAGADSWDSARRDASLSATLETHSLQDRLVASVTAEHWFPLFASASFSRGLIVGSFTSSTETIGFVNALNAGFETVTADAPMSLWPGAGEGHARAPLLRAHPLLVEGVVTGPVFGRHVLFGTEEATYWMTPFKAGRIGLAAFTDTANASARMAAAEGKPFQVDSGVGARLRLPGGTLRVDYALGLRDGEHTVTLGFNWFN